MTASDIDEASLDELHSLRFRLADAARTMESVADGSAWPIRSGQRLGVWAVTTGPLNTVFMLCEAARCAVVVDQTLCPISPFMPPPPAHALHELRIYTLRPGTSDEFATHMRAVLPARTQWSPCAGAWRTQAAGFDRIVHMWSYVDAGQRMAIRPKVDAMPEWQAYVALITPLIDTMESMFLTPLPLPPSR